MQTLLSARAADRVRISTDVVDQKWLTRFLTQANTVTEAKRLEAAGKMEAMVERGECIVTRTQTGTTRVSLASMAAAVTGLRNGR